MQIPAKSHYSGIQDYLEEIPDYPDTDDPTYGLFTLQSETHDLTLLTLEINKSIT